MIIAVIPAKGESGRLKDKNILKINGKTLIEHAVNYAKTSQLIVDIYVSTDTKEIADHANQLNIKTIIREKDLGGETPLIDVYRHAHHQIGDARITHIVGIQPDNPDRHTDIDKAITYAIDKNIDNYFTVDKYGNRNGGLNILNKNAINADPFPYNSTLIDNCTNIHTPFDLEIARRNMSTSSENIQIHKNIIGKRNPTFIIAEAACNHMCDMELAKKMIDEASRAGADAIKFQTYIAEKLVTKNAVAFWGEKEVSQLEYYKRLDRFGAKEYRELFKYAESKKIIAFSSPFDRESADMLDDLDMPVFKIASCDINNIEFIEHIGQYQKPIILSTGASTYDEIDTAIETVFKTGNYKLMLLACTLSYPTKYSDANLNRINSLIERYPGITIGLSDHTEPDAQMVLPSIAVALGARIIEKHYTLDRKMTGSGHFFAMNPNDLAKMVSNIRLAETAFGDGSIGVAKSEKKAWFSARRSIVADRVINKGEYITEDMIGLKRPGDGLPANMINTIVGKKAIVDIGLDQKITLKMIH